jgi:hypothetical protein
LTLPALIIGFSFSMATTRYDQRKNYEEQEANAIGTEYARADLLSPVDAAKVRSQATFAATLARAKRLDAKGNRAGCMRALAAACTTCNDRLARGR